MIRFLPFFAPLAQAARPGASFAEEEWIARAQRHDGEAFRSLFDLHAPSVHRFLRDLTGDAAAADEATQETFVRAYQQLRRLGAGKAFRPWVLGIARNVFREHCRRHRHLPLPRASEAHEEDVVPEPIDPRATPEALLLDREAASHLERALERLSPDRRSALLLQFDHGLSCAEIAEAQGWSIPKVKVELHRARLQLRRELAHLGTEGGDAV